MTTFSQLVDSITAETNRPDLLTSIISYANLTIREVHMEPSRGNAVHFRDNWREEQLISDLDERYSWTIPDVTIFQGLAAVRFDSVYRRDGRPPYAIEQYPGRRSEIEDYIWYRVAEKVYFGGAVGYGGIDGIISLGWFEFPRALKYYPVSTRPASYDVEAGWTYLDGIVTDEQKEAARNKVTNWLLMRWFTFLEEGLRAKIYKRLGDEARSRTSYSLFTQLRQGLFTSEVADLGGLN